MNWIDFFNDHDIPYITSGANLSKGWVGLKCPFCAEDDPSQHMGVNLETGWWSCWRSSNHRGRKPHRLINSLVGTSGADTTVLIRTYTSPDPDAFDAPVTLKKPPKMVLKGVRLPPEFQPIKPYDITGKFWRYLSGRGFNAPGSVVQYYGLMACLRGRWSGRLILPVHHQGMFIGWQARAINKVAKGGVRYLTSSSQVKQVLFNADKASRGETLYVCEGPIDAIKIDAYGLNQGIRAVATMGASPTMPQLAQLDNLKRGFRRTIILFDPDATGLDSSFQISDYVQGIEFGTLPEGLEDIGAATPRQIKEFLNGRHP